MGIFKEQLKKEIPEMPEVIGIYDESNEIWNKSSDNVKLEELKSMNSFVLATISEILRMNSIIKIKEVEFDFIIDEKRVKFSVNIEGIKLEDKIIS